MIAPPPPPHPTVNRLVVHCIFDRPADYPQAVVVARQAITPEGAVIHLPDRAQYPNVPAAVAALERLGLTPLGRDPADVPSLVGTWI